MREQSRDGAAIARLTENEKLCLRRRLLPQTAKEMAVDLGISPHAVEKRLKMARIKLGVSSSLQAARLLADAEGYGPLVPQLSALSRPATPAHEQVQRDAAPRWRVRLIGGVTTMIILLGGLFWALSEPSHGATPQQARAFLVSSFATMDRDHSGNIEPLEAPGVAIRNPDGGRHFVPNPQGARMWIAGFDKDGDGKVSEAEYVAHLLPAIEERGVPANWRADRS